MGQHIVLFHSALGLRPAVSDFAARLRACGHIVQTPDLFDGEVFDNLEDGRRKRDAIGIQALIGRAQAAVASLPNELVFAGFSMGAALAEFLAATRSGARAALLMHGAFDPVDFGIPVWPMVPVQIHYATGDPEVDVGAIRALESAVRTGGASIEVHRYSAGGHLFEDAGLEWQNAESAELMSQRVLTFLAAT